MAYIYPTETLESVVGTSSPSEEPRVAPQVEIPEVEEVVEAKD